MLARPCLGAVAIGRGLAVLALQREGGFSVSVLIIVYTFIREVKQKNARLGDSGRAWVCICGGAYRGSAISSALYASVNASSP